LWVRVLLVACFGALSIIMTAAAFRPGGDDSVAPAALFGVGAAIALVLMISSAVAATSIRVEADAATIRFWIAIRRRSRWPDQSPGGMIAPEREPLPRLAVRHLIDPSRTRNPRSVR
jgi:hypothetical protein